MINVYHSGLFTADSSKKEDVTAQKVEEDTDYGKAVAKLKGGEKKQRVPKVCHQSHT